MAVWGGFSSLNVLEIWQYNERGEWQCSSGRAVEQACREASGEESCARALSQPKGSVELGECVGAGGAVWGSAPRSDQPLL